MSIDFNMAGLVCIHTRRFAFHFFVGKDFWVWGRYKGWYDGPIFEFGLGPLFLIVFIPWLSDED